MRCALPILSAVALSLALSSTLMGQAPSSAAPSDRVVDAARFKSLQEALDAIDPQGGVVLIPPGVYEISEPLKLSTGDVHIEGSGSATHIKNMNEKGQPAFVLQAPKGAKSIWRIKLANFRITGNPKSGDGIVARKVDEFFMQGVTVSYHGGHGVLLDGCYEDPRICNSLFSYNKKTGLAIVKTHDIVVSANHFEENYDALTCADSFNLTMTGNNVDDQLHDGVVIENTYGSVVSGNMIEECQGTAIVLDRDCYGITLSANVIAHDAGGGIDLRDAHGCAVSSNTFTIVPKNALVIGPASGRITVTGNNFSDSNIGESEKRKKDDQAASGITLRATSDIAISGNVFSGLDTRAVDYDEKVCQRIVLTGNVIVDCQE